MQRIVYHITFFLIFFIVSPSVSNAQATYTQLWNEIDLVRLINDKWSAELDLAGTFSNTPSENRVLKTNTQRNFLIWAHYQYSPRWKFSSFIAYYRNKDVPDIGQFAAPEWRLAFQGKYFFHKTGYILNTDMRFEIRFLADEEGDFDDLYRYRQKLKFLLPLNSKILRKGVVFLYASDEIMFRSQAKEEGMKYFDRNLIFVGAGYLITDDLQIELAYANEFVPRDDENIVNNAVALTITFNNLFYKLGKLVMNEIKPAPEE